MSVDFPVLTDRKLQFPEADNLAGGIIQSFLWSMEGDNIGQATIHNFR